MKGIQVEIKGVSGLLMHRFPLEPVEAIEKKSPAEQAELAAYRAPDGELYIPAEAMRQALVAAGTYSKGKGRASLQKVVAAAVFVNPAYIGLGTNKYEIDSRAVVVPATRGRVVRHRPHLPEWTAAFELEYDETLLTEKQLRDVVDNAGALVGILDFRPQTKGPFGRFMVTSWS